MNGTHFDALTARFAAGRTRRGVLGGAAALLAAVTAARSAAPVAARIPPWPCPDGVDGHNSNCFCVCRRFTGDSQACWNACTECGGHIDPVCQNPDERGNPAGPPVCCADRKPCSLVCGDCPDCEPVAGVR